MRTLIVGAGAMGCLFGAKLHLAGYDVTIYNRESETIKAIKHRGIELSVDGQETVTASVPVIDTPSKLAQDYDLVLLLVKAFATEAVLEVIRPKIGANTIVLSLQNGVGNLEKMEQVVPHADLGIGGTGSGASVLGLGRIAHRAFGKTNIGFVYNRQPKRYKRIAEMLTMAGLETEVTDHVNAVVWSKLLINVAFNGMTALTRLRNGDILLPEAGETLVRQLLEEALAVAKKEGISILYENPIEEVLQIGRHEIASNQSSMLTDVMSKRKTEIEVINGAIVKYGAKHGVATPYNDALLKLITVVESSYSKQVDR